MRNLLGPNLLFEALKAVAKVAVVGAVAALTLLPGMKDLAGLVGVPPGALALIAGTARSASPSTRPSPTS